MEYFLVSNRLVTPPGTFIFQLSGARQTSCTPKLLTPQILKAHPKCAFICLSATDKLVFLVFRLMSPDTVLFHLRTL